MFSIKDRPFLQWIVGAAALAALALAAPNSNQAGNWLLAVSRSRATARAFIAGVSVTAIAFLLLVNVTRSSVSAFIYFNF